jgi:WXG100 family type VII secretion target
MAADIHIYIQDAFQESRNLRMIADEVEQESRLLVEKTEELMSVWHGASANRVASAMLRRSKDAQKLSNNLSVISDALYRTAQVYQEATRPGKPTASGSVQPYKTASVSGGGSSGGGGSSWGF